MQGIRVPGGAFPILSGTLLFSPHLSMRATSPFASLCSRANSWFELPYATPSLAEARLEVKELESLAGRLLEDDDRDEIDTLGGLVCAVAGRVPGRGEVVRHPSGLQFEVIEGDPRRLSLLRIRGVTRQPQTTGD